MTESQIQDRIRLVLGSDPACCFWRNNSGVAEMHGYKVRFGVGNPGGADLIGVFRGVFCAIEIKTAIGRLSKEQKLFGELVAKKGGVFAVLRSEDDARAWLAEMHQRFPAQEAA